MVATTEQYPSNTKVPKNKIGIRLSEWVHGLLDSLTWHIVGKRKQRVTEHKPPKIDSTDVMLGTRIEMTQATVAKLIVATKLLYT
jgi:hypothetical protein